MDGVESHHSDHAPELREWLAALAKDLGLATSGGSDFHGKNKPNVTLGRGRGDLEVSIEAFLELKSLAEKVEMLEKRPTTKPKPPASPKAQAAPPAKRYHKMKKGETLTGIAKKYGLSVEELRRMNKFSPKTTLTAGQRLIVRPGGKN